MPEPNSGEKQSDFISRCIPIVISDDKLNPDSKKDRAHAAAKCYGIWREKHKHKMLYTFDMYEDGAIEWDGCIGLESFSNDTDTYPAVCLVGDKFYKGNFLPAKEIEKAYHTMDGAYHDLNHWSTSYPGGFNSESNIEYVVGYQDGTTFDKINKKMKTNIHIEDTAPKSAVWKGFMNICKKAGRVPNVSVTFWADKKDLSVKELPDGVDYKSYGFKDDDVVTVLVDLEFHALATVFQGACDDKAGCGIGITNQSTNIGAYTKSPDTDTVTVAYDTYPTVFYGGTFMTKPFTGWEDTLLIMKINELKKEILKQKIKKEELYNE
jgi:hypothetical protein